MTTRRRFLISVGATALSACAPGTARVDVGDPTPSGPDGSSPGTSPTSPTTSTDTPTGPGPEPPGPWDPEGTVDYVAFAWGLQTGDVTDSAVLVSIRSVEPTLTVVLARGLEDGWEEVARFEDLPADADVVQLELVDLAPDTTWSVVAYAPDGERRSASSRFRTALAPGAQRVVRFGATSCLGGNEPWPTLTWASLELLDFFVLLGDTIYADNAGWGSLDHERSWSEALQVAGLQDLTASTSVIATWDDHEVDDNWSWSDTGMPDTALDALDAFRRAIPQRQGPGGSGIWRKLAWGETLDVFVLDTRGERANGDYVSPDQLQWLMDELSASTARFKIIANSVPITDMSDVYFGVESEDRWDGYPHQRDVILDHVDESGITGVLWIAGDFHWGALVTVGQPGDRGEDQWEVFCGPGGSFLNPIAFLVQPGDHYELVVPQWNVVLFEADPGAGTIRVAFLDDDGLVIDQRTLAV